MTYLRVLVVWFAMSATVFAQEFEQVNTTSPQTLENKTLASPTIDAPYIAGTVTGTPTIPGAVLPNPTITGTVSGGATYAGPTIITSPTINNPTISSPSISNPSITGTVSGGASYTSPTITGTVSGGATYSTPTLTTPIFPGTARSALPAAGTAGRLGRLTDDLGGIWLDNGTSWQAMVPTINATEMAGASVDAQITAAIARCPSTGCIIDARGFVGAVSLAACVNINKPVNLLLGPATITGPANACHFKTWGTGTAQSNVSIVGTGRGLTILKVNGSSVPGGSNRAEPIQLNDPTKTSSQTPCSDYMRVANLTIDGNKAVVPKPASGAANDTTHSGISSSCTRYSTFDNIEAKNFWYLGLSFGLWPSYNTFSNIYTTNNGYDNATGYGGLYLGGTAISNSVSNHVSDADVTGVQVYDNAQFNAVQGIYRNTYHAVSMTDQSGNTSMGNSVTAEAYNCGSQCLSIGGIGTQRNLSVRMLIDTTAADSGAILGTNVSASQFDLVVRRANQHGLDLRGSDNQISLLASENSQGSGLANFAVSGTGALRNSITLHAVDQQGTETQRAIILDASSNYNLVEAYLRGQSSSITDNGTKNIIRYVRSNGTNINSGPLTAISSLSSTVTAANNLAGTMSISDANTSNAYTFPTAEPDTSYYLTVTPSSQVGAPATGSSRIVKIVKTTTTFTVTVETAPGAGTTQNFDWHLFR